MFDKLHVVLKLVYKRSDQLTDKMLDSDDIFYILTDIKSYIFERQMKKVIDSINCEALAAASAHMDPEQQPVPLIPRPQQELDWCVYVCVGISLIDK